MRHRGWLATVLLGVFLFECAMSVSGSDVYALYTTTPNNSLAVNDALVSTLLGHFELGIFEYVGISDTNYYLCIRYRSPIQQVVTWVANRTTPLSSSARLQFSADGTLNLIDTRNKDSGDKPIWSTSTKIGGIGEYFTAQLLDTGNLVVMDANGTKIWNSFNDSSPTDTLLPGQFLYRNKYQKLISWQKDGSPATNDGTYSFGWENNMLSLSWTTPKTFLRWKGGSYIPAGDVHDAHSISDVDFVYFHATLGHLYISSSPSSTAILSGGRDEVNETTLKRITVDKDGGFRIWQWTIGQNSTSWTAIANWVVSERPDSRSQCTTFGTCGPYGMCTSPIDSLDLVQCGCPPVPRFQAINADDPTQGCEVNTSLTSSTTNCINADMLVLKGFDMPWGGVYRYLTGPDSAKCEEACKSDCNCTGAIFSSMEQSCWMKTGFMYNLGYPTVALHGNDRTAFIKVIPDPPNIPADPVESSRNLSLRNTLLIVSAIGLLVLVVICIVCLKRVRGSALTCWGVSRSSVRGCLSRCCGPERRRRHISPTGEEG